MTISMNKLVVASWNASGLVRRQGELLHYLDNSNILMMGINETKFKPNTKFKPRNYEILRKDSIDGQGGVVVLIKKNFSFQEVKRPVLDDLEAICVRIPDNTHIIFMYVRPKKTIPNQILNDLFSVSRKVIIIGDLNARHTSWNNISDNPFGKHLYNFSIYNNIVINFADVYTHCPLNGTHPSNLDIALIKNVVTSDLVAENDLPSDHIPVKLEIGHIGTQNREPTFDYSKANWKLYKAMLNNFPISQNINSIDEIDYNVKRVTEAIQLAASKAIPKKPRHKTAEKLPGNILELIRERNRLRTQYQRGRDIIILQQMKLMNSNIKMKISQHRNNIWSTKLQKLSARDNTLWKITKLLKKPLEGVQPLLTTNNREVFIREEKVELLADSFQEYHNTPPTDQITENTVLGAVNAFLLNNPPNPNNAIEFLTTPEEILSIIKNQSSLKAPGQDKIQNILLKQLPLKILTQLTIIINSIFKYQYFPSLWKTAIVIPIPKPNKPKNQTSSYRPISLLSTISKIAERIIHKHLNNYINIANIIPNEQFGFRREHNCLQQVARIMSDIREKINDKEATAMILLDIEKAFDRVWTKGLIYKLITYEFPPVLIGTINSYLKDRLFKVRIEEVLSTSRAVTAGVPQGSVLGPTLFNIFNSDIPKNDKTNIALFADDTALYVSAKTPDLAFRRLRTHIPKVEKYLTKWKTTVNAAKTETILFTKRGVIPYVQPTKLYGVSIRSQPTVKYLGVHLDTRQTFKEHVLRNIANTSAAIRSLYPLIINKNTSVYNKLLMFKVILRPALIYAAPVFNNIAKVHLNKLQVMQNKCLRLALHESRYTNNRNLHRKAKMETVEEYINKTSTKFYKKTINHSNSLIANITGKRTHMTHKQIFEDLNLLNE